MQWRVEHSWGQGRCTLSCGGGPDHFDDDFDDHFDDYDDDLYDNNDDDGHDDDDHDDHEYDGDDDYDGAQLGQAPCTLSCPHHEQDDHHYDQGNHYHDGDPHYVGPSQVDQV